MWESGGIGEMCALFFRSWLSETGLCRDHEQLFGAIGFWIAGKEAPWTIIDGFVMCIMSSALWGNNLPFSKLHLYFPMFSRLVFFDFFCIFVPLWFFVWFGDCFATPGWVCDEVRGFCFDFRFGPFVALLRQCLSVPVIYFVFASLLPACTYILQLDILKFLWLLILHCVLWGFVTKQALRKMLFFSTVFVRPDLSQIPTKHNVKWTITIRCPIVEYMGSKNQKK